MKAHLTLDLPGDWTPEQALAVFEMLNTLTDTLWSRYDLAIIELLSGDLYYSDTSQLDLFDRDDSPPF